MDRFRFNQGASEVITGVLRDQDDALIDTSLIATATVTLYNADTYDPTGSPITGIINGRDQQNVLGVNNVSFPNDSPITGTFVWNVQPADNQPPDDAESAALVAHQQIWRNRAAFIFLTSAGLQIPYECELEVINLRSIP